MAMRPGDQIELIAQDLDLDGLGVGATAAVEVHAVDLLPGESGVVAIEHVSRHSPRAWGRASGRIGPDSPARAAPACPAFGRCGGCAWQHLSYPAQLAHKRRRVEAALADALADPPPVADVVGSARVLGYRNKATYVVARGRAVAGAVALGAYAPRTHRWVSTAGCRVVAPAIDQVAQAVAAALSAETPPLQVHDERHRRGHLRHVVIRASRAGRVLVGLVTTRDAPRDALERAAGAVLAAPGVAGVLWNRNDATSGVVLGPTTEPLAGAASIAETLAGVTIDVTLDTFLQVDLDQAEALYARLADHVAPDLATGGATALDLYCGAGAIAFTLAGRGARVLGVERNPHAVEVARGAAARAGLSERARFEAAPAGDAVPLLRGDGSVPAPAVVVVNPPRQGLGADVRAALAAHPPPVLAYVSCGPSSLARDLAELAAAAGYRIDAVLPFDLMPGTGHVETLVILRRPRREVRSAAAAPRGAP